MKCEQCGSETNGALICPNCGAPVQSGGGAMPTFGQTQVGGTTSYGQGQMGGIPTYGSSNPAGNTSTDVNGYQPVNDPYSMGGGYQTQGSPYANQGMNPYPQNTNNYTRVPDKPKNSTLGIVALILSCTIILSFFGLIIAIVDIIIKDGKKKTLSYVAAGIGGFFLLIIIVGAALGGDDSSKKEEIKITAENEVEDQTNSEKIEGNDKTEVKTNEKSGSTKIEYEITDTGFEYYKNSIGDIEYYGFVEITNTGKGNLYLDNCVFDIEDNEGHLLQSDDFISSCPDIIKPGEKGYFYNNIGSTLLDKGISTANGVNLVPQISVESTNTDPIDYDVSDTDIKKDSYGALKVTGRVTNNTSEDESYLYVEIIFYDSEGKVIGITGTSITDLNAGKTVSFDTTTLFGNDSINLDNVADYKVIARAHHYQW